MRGAPEITNVVEACNLEGRQERLENQLAQLELCEKALQDYLETKRIAFPRFYFVAPADLLDILSKGSNPQLILRHLPKCFDNIHNLSFRKDEAGVPTKAAIGMHSGETEYVEFAEDCSCEGPVELWLQNVVDSMKQALRVEYQKAISAYDENPRTQWIFKFSAQNTIVVSRTFFTMEVNEAFEELEEGNEDAMKVSFFPSVPYRTQGRIPWFGPIASCPSPDPSLSLSSHSRLRCPSSLSSLMRSTSPSAPWTERSSSCFAPLTSTPAT